MGEVYRVERDPAEVPTRPRAPPPAPIVTDARPAAQERRKREAEKEIERKVDPEELRTLRELVASYGLPSLVVAKALHDRAVADGTNARVCAPPLPLRRSHPPRDGC